MSWGISMLNHGRRINVNQGIPQKLHLTDGKGDKRLFVGKIVNPNSMVRSEADITMCLKQNPKIKKWKEQTIKKGHWKDYGENCRIASQDKDP